VLRVTADSNIFISALNFGGLPDKLLALARHGEIEIAVSEAIIDEVSRVLRGKFRWTEEAINSARVQISEFTEHVVPALHINAVPEDPDDNRILECAAAADSEYIVTGDKHLLRLAHFGAVKIVTPADFLEIYLQAVRDQ
jgi:uncharacterized protein